MTYLFRSRDGLLSTNDPQAVADWDARAARAEDDEASWTARLRAAGITFAAPDDGWVKRNADGTGVVSLSWYPQFNDNPEVGDLVALGTPPEGEHYRPVVTGAGWERRRWRRGEWWNPGTVKVPESAYDGYRLCRVTEIAERHHHVFRTSPGYRTLRFSYEDTGARIPAPDHLPSRWHRWRILRPLIGPVVLTGLAALALRVLS